MANILKGKELINGTVTKDKLSVDVQSILDTPYLPLTGGTMSGAIVSSSSSNFAGGVTSGSDVFIRSANLRITGPSSHTGGMIITSNETTPTTYSSVRRIGSGGLSINTFDGPIQLNSNTIATYNGNEILTLAGNSSSNPITGNIVLNTSSQLTFGGYQYPNIYANNVAGLVVSSGSIVTGGINVNTEGTNTFKYNGVEVATITNTQSSTVSNTTSYTLSNNVEQSVLSTTVPVTKTGARNVRATITFNAPDSILALVNLSTVFIPIQIRYYQAGSLIYTSNHSIPRNGQNNTMTANRVVSLTAGQTIEVRVYASFTTGTISIPALIKELAIT